VDRGCCGMGGAFGMKCCNYQMSMDLGDALFAALKELEPDMVISECPACRSQIAHGTALPVSHPIMIVKRALATVCTQSESTELGTEEQTASISIPTAVGSGR